MTSAGPIATIMVIRSHNHAKQYSLHLSNIHYLKQVRNTSDCNMIARGCKSRAIGVQYLIGVRLHG